MKALRPALQSSTGRSTDWGGATLINCFAEKGDGDKRADFAVMATPGLTVWGAIAAGPIRGMHFLSGVLYVVSGTSLYSVNSSGVETLIGAVGGADPVKMASNYTELAIAANGTGYVYSAGALTTPLGYSVSDVFYADGYIVWIVGESEQFIISALDDALTYDALDITSVEGYPDDIVGGVNNHRELMFFGANTTEIYYNSGNADFPFERQGNAFVERGCFDRNSIVKIDNAVDFVGDDRIVYSVYGYAPQRISTHAIEYLLRDCTYARAFTYAQEGHKFYVLTCDRGTLVFDHVTGTWHQRKSWDSDFWRCNGAVTAYGKTLLSDMTNGNIYTVSLDVYTENDETIAVQIDLPVIEAGREPLIMHSFELVCETGVGNDDAPTPQVMLQTSKDGGHTWSNEMWRTIMGSVGDYSRRAIWRKLGQFHQIQMRIKITDAVRRMVIGYFADIE